MAAFAFFRTRWPPGVAFGIALLLIVGVMGYRWTRRPVLPRAVVTKGLDLAVASLIEHSEQTVRDNPRSGDAWGRLGSALMHYEFIEEAREAFVRAQQLSPGNPRWPYLQALLEMSANVSAVTPLLRRASNLCGDLPDMPRVQLARWLAEHGDSLGARQEFEVLLRREANHPIALLGLARLHFAEGRLEAGRVTAQSCIDNPHTVRAAHALMAQIQHALANREAAAAAARQAALTADLPWPDPFWTEASAFRVGQKAMIQDASALLDQDQMKEALEILARLTRDYPENEEGWYLMGWAMNRSQRASDAERALREYLKRAPQSPKGHAQLAVSLLAQQRPSEAVAVLEAALRIKPTWRELHFNLAYALAQLGHDKEAIQQLREAIAIDPNHVATHAALAELLIRHGERIEAQGLLQRALELDPGDERAGALLRSLSTR
ncbi:MAG: hypothetical protein QOF48_858 [Verrucomicrobiota bacterium]|jgi:tetratricopeptide (TPR) repeat protein